MGRRDGGAGGFLRRRSQGPKPGLRTIQKERGGYFGLYKGLRWLRGNDARRLEALSTYMNSSYRQDEAVSSTPPGRTLLSIMQGGADLADKVVLQCHCYYYSLQALVEHLLDPMFVSIHVTIVRLALKHVYGSSATLKQFDVPLKRDASGGFWEGPLAV